jgi:hypothetical protein
MSCGGSSAVSIHRPHGPPSLVGGKLEVQRLPKRAQDQDSQLSRRSRASKAKLFECTPHSGLAHMDSDAF